MSLWRLSIYNWGDLNKKYWCGISSVASSGGHNGPDIDREVPKCAKIKQFVSVEYNECIWKEVWYHESTKSLLIGC